MAAIQVYGMNPLEGEISVHGSKNGALPVMAGALLHKGVTVLLNVPDIEDTRCMVDILKELGCSCKKEGIRLVIDASKAAGTEVPEKYVKAMRSSIIILGALLGRMKEGRCSMPGGCLIGERPVDLHLMVLRGLGAEITEKEGQFNGNAGSGLLGAELYLPYPSVGATEQAILAAVLAEGVTVIHGAAREPEISQLCSFLNGMGAVICGMGTDHLMIQGVKKLHDSLWKVEGDRIVAGTYCSAVMMAGGSITLNEVRPEQLEEPLKQFEQAGAVLEKDRERLFISMKGRPAPLNIATGPYPGFPTDMQSLFMAFLSIAKGKSCITETVFEDRFGTAADLVKMGADITCQGKKAVINGVPFLTGTKVRALDLRGGAALVTAALKAEGSTIIEDCHHIKRGYEDICRDLQALGGRVYWMESDTG